MIYQHNTNFLTKTTSSTTTTTGSSSTTYSSSSLSLTNALVQKFIPVRQSLQCFQRVDSWSWVIAYILNIHNDMIECKRRQYFFIKHYVRTIRSRLLMFTCRHHIHHVLNKCHVTWQKGSYKTLQIWNFYFLPLRLITCKSSFW